MRLQPRRSKTCWTRWKNASATNSRNDAEKKRMQGINLEIIGIAQRREHLELAEAKARAVKMGVRFLTNKEVDELLQDEKMVAKFHAYFRAGRPPRSVSTDRIAR